MSDMCENEGLHQAWCSPFHVCMRISVARSFHQNRCRRHRQCRPYSRYYPCRLGSPCCPGFLCFRGQVYCQDWCHRSVPWLFA